MASDDKLLQWWNGLNEAQRADAATYGRSGQLSTDLKASLLSAGLLQPDQQQPSRRLESRVDEFLKMRHDT